MFPILLDTGFTHIKPGKVVEVRAIANLVSAHLQITRDNPPRIIESLAIELTSRPSTCAFARKLANESPRRSRDNVLNEDSDAARRPSID